MADRFVALILNEGAWLPASMGLALLAVSASWSRHRHGRSLSRQHVAAAMNLFLGTTIAVMAFGHFLAVSTKAAIGTLDGPPAKVYAIGIVLAIPSWRLIAHGRRQFTGDGDDLRRTVGLNSWLALTLLALGIHNLPLAAPALFNIGYALHSRRIVGWAMVSLAILVNAGLFLGSLVFMASGQTFEQFSGIQ
jgi:hypothetical protein